MRATASPLDSAQKRCSQANWAFKALSHQRTDFRRLTTLGASLDDAPNRAEELFRRGQVAKALQWIHLAHMARMLGIDEASVVARYGWPPLPRIPESVVYLVAHSTRPVDDESVKIGVARNLRNRMENLQAGSVHPLILLAYREGDRAAEQALHKRLEAWRIREDWFRMCGAIRGEFGLADSHSLPVVGGVAA
jgi:hypothetical protein